MWSTVKSAIKFYFEPLFTQRWRTIFLLYVLPFLIGFIIIGWPVLKTLLK